MASIEERLRAHQLLESKPKYPFLPSKDKTEFGIPPVLDDHVPFLERGVDCLHIAPFPFPDVWHTIEDDGAHLDMPTVEDWAIITTAFLAEWMDLEGFISSKEEALKKIAGQRSLRATEKTEL